MMELCFVSNVVYPFVPGGAQKRIHEIGTRLAAKGHHVTICSRHFWSGPEEMIHEGMTLQAVAPSTDLYEEDRRSITEAIDFALRLIPELRRQLKGHDLVVVSVFPYFPVISSRLCATTNDTPLITTWHEVWREYWDDYLGYLAPFGKMVEQLTARVPQHPVAVSETTAHRLTELGPNRDQITVIPNGINVERVQSGSPTTNKFDVLFAGRLIRDKHVDRLLLAFDQIAGDYDATLGVIGDGPQHDKLERIAEECENQHQITFLGFLDDYEDVLAHMRAAQVFASPSTREGFGIAYLEAMAADCTVIGVDHPDSAAAEVIDDGGYVVDPTVDALADALDRALAGERPPKDPASVASQYDWDVVAEQAEEVYRSVINGQ